MWNMMNSMGNPTHSLGPFTPQKRQFSVSVEKVPLVPGRTFTKPSCIQITNPSVCNLKQQNFISIPIEQVSHCDSPLINSSHSLVDTIKEHNFDIVKNQAPTYKVNTKIRKMCKKQGRNSRRNRKRQASGKTSKQTDTKNYINDMMEIELDIETSLNCSEISISPNIPSNNFKLTDFIVNKHNKLPKDTMEAENGYGSDEEEFVTTIISVSPVSSFCKTSIRDRQVSISESEDSFIVFDRESDGEGESSEESDSETEEESSSESEVDSEEEEDEGRDEIDFIFAPTPNKKVRFADDRDLCVVHTMVQWSFAYQQARKGHWEEYARDRDRFKRKAAQIERVLTPVLDAAHRSQIYRERFQDKI